LERRKVSDQHRSSSATVESGRGDLPLMTNGPPQQINSPSTRHNNHHTLVVRDAKVEEPRSPQPSSFVPENNKIKHEDEEMADIKSSKDRTTAPASPATKAAKTEENINEDTEMED
jgi:hypothetical protein